MKYLKTTRNGTFLYLVPSEVKPVNDEERRQMSIEKWETIRDNPQIAFYGISTCGFCPEYLHGDDPCANCPVRLATGRVYCYGTPHERALDAISEGFWDLASKLAQEEIDFLKSLCIP